MRTEHQSTAAMRKGEVKKRRKGRGNRNKWKEKEIKKRKEATSHNLNRRKQASGVKEEEKQ